MGAARQSQGKAGGLRQEKRVWRAPLAHSCHAHGPTTHYRHYRDDGAAVRAAPCGILLAGQGMERAMKAPIKDATRARTWAAAGLALALAGCATALPPVEVTRFHGDAVAQAGTIRVVPADP